MRQASFDGDCGGVHVLVYVHCTRNMFLENLDLDLDSKSKNSVPDNKYKLLEVFRIQIAAWILIQICIRCTDPDPFFKQHFFTHSVFLLSFLLFSYIKLLNCVDLNSKGSKTGRYEKILAFETWGFHLDPDPY